MAESVGFQPTNRMTPGYPLPRRTQSSTLPTLHKQRPGGHTEVACGFCDQQTPTDGMDTEPKNRALSLFLEVRAEGTFIVRDRQAWQSSGNVRVSDHMPTRKDQHKPPREETLAEPLPPRSEFDAALGRVLKVSKEQSDRQLKELHRQNQANRQK